MDDFLLFALSALLCSAPVVLIVTLAVALSRTRDLKLRVEAQEEGLRQLGMQNERLHARLAQLEAAQLEVSQSAGASAPEPRTAIAEEPPRSAASGLSQLTADPPVPALGEPPMASAPVAELAASAERQAAPAKDKPPVAATPEPNAAQPADAAANPPLGGLGPVPAPVPDAPAPNAPPPGATDTGEPQDGEGLGWEEWIGVKGLAAVGSAILVLAGVYLFSYSIEHGLLSPTARFALGMGAGLGCLLLAEVRLRARYEVAASWIAGAGIGLLYVASWAGQALYALYPTWVAGGLMVLTTVVCVLLAERRNAPSTAVLGLIGGFLTPLALSTGSDRPIPLFAYLLVLDVAMIGLAVRRKWRWLAGLALLATLFYQFAWLFLRMSADTRWIGSAVLVVFLLLFAFAPVFLARNADESEEKSWRIFQVAAVAAGVGLVLMLSLRADFGANLGASAAQLIALAAASAWIARRVPIVGVVGALGTQAALVVAIVRVEGAALGLGLAALSAAGAFPFALSSSRRGWRVDAALAACAGAAVNAWLLLAASGPPQPMAAVLLACTLALFAFFASLRGERLGAFLAVLIGLAALVARGFVLGMRVEVFGGPSTAMGVLVLLALLVHVPGFLPRTKAVREMADWVAIASAALFGWALTLDPSPALPLHLARFILLLSAVFAAARSAHGRSLLLATLSFGASALFVSEHRALALGGGMLSVCALMVAPLVFRRLHATPAAWRAAATAPLVFLPALFVAYRELFGSGALGLLPVALGVPTLLVARAMHKRPPEERMSATIWLVGSAAALTTVAIPMQLEEAWLTIGWALEAWVLALLWRRFDHAGLKYTTLGLALLVFVRLALNPFVLDYDLRATLRVLNWVSYTYLVPALALALAHRAMAPLETSRVRSWEPTWNGAPIVAGLFGLFALILVFCWLNLTVFDFFAEGPALTIPTARMPARDLCTSLSWALYALVLLALGVAQKSRALRYASLALLLLTSLKVFLYDLGTLDELYRVASLAGLALTLILISLAYRRFVFADEAPKGNEP